MVEARPGGVPAARQARRMHQHTGLHPKLHTAITIGRGILGLSEPAYYTKGVLQ